MSFHRENHRVAITAGKGSKRTDLSLRGILSQIMITPTTSSNQWTMELVEAKTGMVVAAWDDEIGTLNSSFGLDIPMSGYYAFNFSNVEIDEDINVRITIRELPYGGH